MESTRPLSLSWKYAREQIATYFADVAARADLTAPVAVFAFSTGAASVLLGMTAGHIAAGVLNAWTVASSSASSAAHESAVNIAHFLYFVRCSIEAHTVQLSAVATVAVTIMLTRDLLCRISIAVDLIEARKAKIYDVIRDKFVDCIRCSHKVSCAFFSYEKLALTAERAFKDLGVNFFALQNDAMLRGARSRLSLSSIVEVFSRPQTQPPEPAAAVVAEIVEAPL